MAAVQDDVELTRLMEHLSLEIDFPKTKPARSPPSGRDVEENQLNPAIDAWDGVDET